MQKCLMVSIENSVYHSQFSVFITKGFAVMRFSHHVLELSCIPTLFILMCWAYVIKRVWNQIMTLHSQSLCPHLRYCLKQEKQLLTLKIAGFCVREWMWGWKPEHLTHSHWTTSLNLLHQWNESWTKGGVLEDICIYTSTSLWGSFSLCGDLAIPRARSFHNLLSPSPQKYLR